MERGSKWPLVAVAPLLLCASLDAQQGGPHDRLAFHLGADGISDPDQLLRGGIEYRFGANWHGIHPELGVSFTEAVDLYTYVGFRYPWELGERWRLSPAFGVGFFKDDGGLDLGGRVQFRSAAALSYRLTERSEIGLEFWHLSNSNLGDINPGTESLLVTYSLALGR